MICNVLLQIRGSHGPDLGRLLPAAQLRGVPPPAGEGEGRDDAGLASQRRLPRHRIIRRLSKGLDKGWWVFVCPFPWNMSLFSLPWGYQGANREVYPPCHIIRIRLAACAGKGGGAVGGSQYLTIQPHLLSGIPALEILNTVMIALPLVDSLCKLPGVVRLSSQAILLSLKSSPPKIGSPPLQTPHLLHNASQQVPRGLCRDVSAVAGGACRANLFAEMESEGRPAAHRQSGQDGHRVDQGWRHQAAILLPFRSPPPFPQTIKAGAIQ